MSIGEITSIDVVFVGSNSGTHELRIAPIVGTPTAAIGGPLYQTFTNSGGGPVTINLNTPFPVTAGNNYVFDITRGATIALTGFFLGSPSGVGYIATTGGGFSSLGDLNFSVEISPSSNPAPTSIPTLSEWGLIILALLLMTAGTLYLVQPNWRGRLER